MRIWAVANQKGGVGKTTTAVTLGGLLAERGQRVLLLDLDPHGSMSSYFRYDPDTLKRSSYTLFAEQSLALSDLQSLIVPTPCDGLDLLPASMLLATIERRATQEGMGRKVSSALARLWDLYDYAIIDSPPVLGALMINALAACEHLLVPVQTEFLAIKGLDRMLRTIAMVSSSLRKTIHYTIVPTMFDRRTQASVGSLREMRNNYTDHIWASMVPIDTRFRDASKRGLPLSVYDSQARGVQAYNSLLKLLLADHCGRAKAEVSN